MPCELNVNVRENAGVQLGRGDKTPADSIIGGRVLAAKNRNPHNGRAGSEGRILGSPGYGMITICGAVSAGLLETIVVPRLAVTTIG